MKVVNSHSSVCPHLRGGFVPADGPFVLPHAGPQTFASFSDIFNRALAASKAVDDIGFIVWFQGVLGSHQGGAQGLHRFMRHQYPMFGQKCARLPPMLLVYKGPLRGLSVVALRPFVYGVEASSKEIPVLPVLLADPVKVLRLFSFCICSGAVRLNSS